MLDDKAIGLSLEEDFEYTWRDVALYNLAVGAQATELEYVYEKCIKAVPSFGTIPCTATFGTIPFHANLTAPTSLVEMPKGGVVHMDQKLVIKKAIPVNAKVHVKKVISDVFDKGEKGAKINVDVIAYDESGDELFVNTMGYMRQNVGGWGGKPVPAPEFAMPTTECDFTISGEYGMNAAALYRLTGDINPLHVDAKFAQMVGFKQPIVHGLCSYGMACKLLTDKLLPGESEKMKSLQVQFRGAALPGDKFTIQGWNVEEGTVLFRMVNAEGKAILDFGKMTF